MRLAFRSILFAAMIALTGCAEMQAMTGIQKLTLDEQIAAGYATVTAVRTTASTLLKAQKITADDAQNVQNIADTARAGLDVARTLAKINPAGAANKLASVNAAVRAVQNYLVTKEK